MPKRVTESATGVRSLSVIKRHECERAASWVSRPGPKSKAALSISLANQNAGIGPFPTKRRGPYAGPGRSIG